MEKDYVKSIPFRGDVRKAMEFVRDTYVRLNFAVSRVTDSRVSINNPNSLRNTGQNPLLYVSEATISVEGSMITFEADFGKFRSLLKLVAIILLPTSFVIDIGIAIAIWNISQLASVVVLVSSLPLIVILPVLYKVKKKSASQALDTLLQNIVAAAGDSSH